MTLADLRAAFETRNVKAFYAVVRHTESSNDDSAYTLVNLAAPDDPVRGVKNHHFTVFANHPYAGLSTRAPLPSQRGYAAGAPQFIPSTWADVVQQYGMSDFSPPNQDAGYVARLVYRGALDDVIVGRFEQAVAKCRLEWSSLPGGAGESRSDWTMGKARAFFVKSGGVLEGTPPDAIPLPKPPARPSKEPPMGALAALQLFAPILSGLIPQIAGILKPESEVAKRNTALAQTLVDTITQAAGATNMLAAVENMQADPAVQDAVQKAVVTEPSVMASLQLVDVGGGAKAAAERDLVASQSDKPFWKTSAVFWISILLLPMVYWYVGSSVVGGVEIPESAPWYVQLLKMFGTGWSPDARSGLANLVLGLVLGGICGVYYGISVTQSKAANSTTSKEA